MKSPHLHLRVSVMFVVLAGLLLAGCSLPRLHVPFLGKKSSAPSPTEEPPGLQVTVEVPPTWRPFLDEDVAGAFGQRLSDAFRQRGYGRKILLLDHGATAYNTVPTLRVRLTEWRIDPTGQARCTISTSLAAPDGTNTDLGLMTDSALFRPTGRSGFHWGVRALEQDSAPADTAQTALRTLYDRLANTGKVDGLVAR